MKSSIWNNSRSCITNRPYHFFLVQNVARHESGCLNGVLMAVHPATLSNNARLNAGEGVWAEFRVGTFLGLHGRYNVLTNKIVSPPIVPQCAKYIKFLFSLYWHVIWFFYWHFCYSKNSSISFLNSNMTALVTREDFDSLPYSCSSIWCP